MSGSLIYNNSNLAVLHKLANADVKTWPYPHFYVEDVFPTDMYAKMQEHWPDDETEFRRAEDYGETNRLYLSLGDDEDLARMDEAKSTFWRSMRDMLFDQWFMECLSIQFEPFFKKHPWVAQGKVKQLKLTPYASLNNDPVGWSIGPHTQNLREFLFIIFYVPPPGISETYGTSIYVPQKRNLKCDGGPHYYFKYFDRVATAPYRPNSALGLCKTNDSFHGVEGHEATGYRRTFFYAIGLPFN